MDKLPTSRDYTGRQVDLEFLHEIQLPAGVVSVDMRLGNPKVSRSVTGIQKAVQRYVIVFLTELGSIRHDPRIGTRSVQQLRSVASRGPSWVRGVFTVANRRALSIIRSEDQDTETYGDIPDDERIESVELMGSTYDAGNSVLSLTIGVTTRAGLMFRFVIPTPIPSR